MKIITQEEIDSLNFQELTVKSQQMLNSWNGEDTFFTALLNDPDFEKSEFQKYVTNTTNTASKLRGLLTSFTTNNHPNNKNTNVNLPQDRKHALLKEHIERFNVAYGELIDYRRNQSYLLSIENKISEQMTFLEASIITSVDKKVDELTKEVKNDISIGIKNLIGLKSELGLAKQFGEKIKSELDEAREKEKQFMFAFLGALVLMPILVCVEQFYLTSIEGVSSYILKGSIIVSLLFISLFFFSQYKTYMTIRLRYTHLDGFLGGGATFIAQLVESENSEFKLEINKKLAELFMSLDDILKVLHKSKHPTEMTLDRVEGFLEKASKLRKLS